MPTAMISMATLPCLIGLRTLRPRRLFGFNGLTDGAPLSPTACNDLGVCGLPSVTASAIIADLRISDLQGVTNSRQTVTPRPRGERTFDPAGYAAISKPAIQPHPPCQRRSPKADWPEQDVVGWERRHAFSHASSDPCRSAASQRREGAQ